MGSEEAMRSHSAWPVRSEEDAALLLELSTRSSFICGCMSAHWFANIFTPPAHQFKTQFDILSCVDNYQSLRHTCRGRR